MSSKSRRNWSARIAIFAVIVALIVLVGYPLSIGPSFVVWALLQKFGLEPDSSPTARWVFNHFIFPMFEWSRYLPDCIELYWWFWTDWWRRLARRI